ncbi:MAG: hypothetical protein M1348_03645 [Candidatus Parvarchaeota archaeon]|jgi:cytosine/uracil/thiamine/allantoin permease|nr:hypothetical protein [Candidatus Parvarchaeota archaeon]MCL5101673.1 hypothetical protein [Candidatus Parvarchaeota archaeon]
MKYKWKSTGKASTLWYIAGLLGSVGYIVGLVYVMLTNNKNKLWSLLYFLGIIGSVIIYIMFRKKDKKFADMSIKLLTGSLITSVGVLAIILLRTLI